MGLSRNKFNNTLPTINPNNSRGVLVKLICAPQPSTRMPNYLGNRSGRHEGLGRASLQIAKIFTPISITLIVFYCYLILKYAGYTAKKRFLTKWRLAPKRKKKTKHKWTNEKKKKYRLVYHEVQCNYLLVTFNCVPVGPKCVLSVKYDSTRLPVFIFRLTFIPKWEHEMKT